MMPRYSAACAHYLTPNLKPILQKWKPTLIGVHPYTDPHNFTSFSNRPTHQVLPCPLMNNYYITVFLSRFGTFLRSELKFSKLPVQSSHHCVNGAHQKSSFSFLWTSCKGTCTFMQMIMYNSLLFPTLSIAYVMLIKMYCNGSLLNSLTPTTFRH